MILPSGQMATFIFFPLSQVIVMAAAMMIISYYGWFRDKNTGLPFLEDPTRAPMIMLCVAAVLCIISDAVLLYIMVRSSQNEKLREELRIKDYQNALNLEYYKNVENSSNEVRKIRHDLANIIQTAYEVVHSGNEVDREAAERMLDQLRTEVADIKIENSVSTLLSMLSPRTRRTSAERMTSPMISTSMCRGLLVSKMSISARRMSIFSTTR